MHIHVYTCIFHTCTCTCMWFSRIYIKHTHLFYKYIVHVHMYLVADTYCINIHVHVLWIQLSQLSCLGSSVGRPPESLYTCTCMLCIHNSLGSSKTMKITGCFGCMHLPCIILHVHCIYMYMYMYNVHACELT